MDSVVRGTVTAAAAGVTNVSISLPSPAEGYVWEVSQLQVATSAGNVIVAATGYLGAAPATGAAVVGLMAGGGFLSLAFSSLGVPMPAYGGMPATGPRCVNGALVLAVYASAAATVAYEIGIKRKRLTQDILNSMAGYTS